MIAKGGLTKVEIENNILSVKVWFRNRKFSLNEYDVVIEEFKESGKIRNGVLKLNIGKKKKNRMKSVLNVTIPYNNMEQQNFNEIVKYLKNNKIEKMKRQGKEGLIFVAEGDRATIELYEKKLIIKRDPNSLSNLAIHGIKGDKEIKLKTITAIQLSESYIQFTLPGYIESRGGLFEAIADENTVIFKKSQFEDFKNLKDLINRYADMDSTRDKNDKNHKEDAIGDLERLAKLRENNAITEEEYNAKKQELLKRI